MGQSEDEPQQNWLFRRTMGQGGGKKPELSLNEGAEFDEGRFDGGTVNFLSESAKGCLRSSSPHAEVKSRSISRLEGV